MKYQKSFRGYLMKKILLINDLPGYGNVALSAMIPIFSCLGLETCSLPTALLSNTLNYEKYEILDTTVYMRRTLEAWDQLGFCFDAIAVGFIVSEEQAYLIADFCGKQRKRGIPVFVDPILGDNGRLYNGITERRVSEMRGLVSVADVIVPNYTEACFLAGQAYSADTESIDSIRSLIGRLLELGAGSVVITSSLIDDRKQVCGYDGREKEYFFLPYHEIPGHFYGTGDIFSAFMIGHIMKGSTLKAAVRTAMTTVEQMIQDSGDGPYVTVPGITSLR